MASGRRTQRSLVAPSGGRWPRSGPESLHKGDRVIITGRIEQRSWEDTRRARSVPSVELWIEEIGPSLRWATASVNRVTRGNSDSGFGGGGRRISRWMPPIAGRPVARDDLRPRRGPVLGSPQIRTNTMATEKHARADQDDSRRYKKKACPFWSKASRRSTSTTRT